VEKIAALAGSRIGEVLASSVEFFNTTKHTNEEIYDTVEVIEKAKRACHPVSFFYFNLDENKNRIYHHDKQRYIVEPYRMILMEDNYYLVGYSLQNAEMRVYRLDRMEGVCIEDSPFTEEGKAAFEAMKKKASDGALFSMYMGETTEVTLYFTSDLIGAVYDRFGEATHMTRVNSECIAAAVRVQLSPVFYGWVAQFGGKMKIISPDKVIRGFKEHVANVSKTFESFT
jgi:predicted DNA-binding transcriptional regulator YafY